MKVRTTHSICVSVHTASFEKLNFYNFDISLNGTRRHSGDILREASAYKKARI